MENTSKKQKRLNADIPEDVFKEFSLICVQQGKSKRDMLLEILTKFIEKEKK
jgi:hypothetical protein